METKEGHEHSGCAACMHKMCTKHHWGHILIKVLVALFIFWAGVQFGELKGILHDSYGYGMMGAYRTNTGQNTFYGTPGGMMGGWTQ